MKIWENKILRIVLGFLIGLAGWVLIIFIMKIAAVLSFVAHYNSMVGG